MSWQYTSITNASLDFNGTQSYEFVVQAINSDQLYSKSGSISGTTRPIAAIGKGYSRHTTTKTLSYLCRSPML